MRGKPSYVSKRVWGQKENPRTGACEQNNNMSTCRLAILVFLVSHPSTRWAPTTCFWSYNPYKWRYFTLLITGFWAHLVLRLDILCEWKVRGQEFAKPFPFRHDFGEAINNSLKKALRIQVCPKKGISATIL